MRTLLLLLLTVTCSVFAQTQPIVFSKQKLEKEWIFDLSQYNWKFANGDSAHWATAAFNDAHWLTTTTTIEATDDTSDLSLVEVQRFTTKRLESSQKVVNITNFSGVGWFRFHFFVDSSLLHIPLAWVVQQRGASEIYLDGKRLKRIGTFSGVERTRYESDKSPIVFELNEAGEHVLAIKYENYSVVKDNKKYGISDAGFSVELSTYNVSYQNTLGSTLAGSFFFLSSGGIFVALFLAHLILYLYYRKVITNFVFSLFNLGLALLFFSLFFKLNATALQIIDTLSVVSKIALCISCFALSALVKAVFSKSRLRLAIVGAFCVATICVATVSSMYSMIMLAVVGAYCSLEAVISVLIAIYKRTPGARILGAGILFLFGFCGVIALISYVNGGIELQEGILLYVATATALLALFSIPFSMSAYLAWSYASVNKSLTVQLHKVEKLSQEALQQEIEKQRLLENRKEELEQQVAQRTFEVLRQKNQIEIQHEALKSEKQKSDELLLNILPSEVADELKESGFSKARHFDQVTVLFTDFVNFTSIAEKLSPEVLVQELHECFRVFDEIMQRHDLEKIKTIGDAYLAVSGLPTYHEDHALRAVKAALEIVEFVHSRKSTTTPFDIRIGLHSGALVAGIVGVKKFAYDIWGDTVNTAARMESASLPGRINISEATYQLVERSVEVEKRGKLNVKNKGDMEMYFVVKIN